MISPVPDPVLAARQDAARIVMDAVLLAIMNGYLDRQLGKLERGIKERRAQLPIQDVTA